MQRTGVSPDPAGSVDAVMGRNLFDTRAPVNGRDEAGWSGPCAAA